MKRILVDLNPSIVNAKTGVGYYISHLVSSLSNYLGPNDSMVGYYFNFLGRKQVDAITPVTYQSKLLPARVLSLCRRLGFQLPLGVFVPKRANIVLFTNYVSLPTRKKKVLFVYDLSFLDCPEFTQSKNLRFLQRFCPPSVESADLIITISEFTKQRILSHFPSLKTNIVVTPIPPIDKVVTKNPLSPKLLAKGVQENKYILFLGTIEPRKNVSALVAAYKLLAKDLQEEYTLVLAGGKGWKDQTMAQIISDAQEEGLSVIQTGYVSDGERGELYANATCFVLPSHYEGFGMPIFEAMQYDVPVALSDIAVFHEVAADAALYFDKDSHADLAAKLTTLLTDTSLRQALTRAGREQLTRYSWARNAEAVSNALNRLGN